MIKRQIVWDKNKACLSPYTKIYFGEENKVLFFLEDGKNIVVSGIDRLKLTELFVCLTTPTQKEFLKQKVKEILGEGTEVIVETMIKLGVLEICE